MAIDIANELLLRFERDEILSGLGGPVWQRYQGFSFNSYPNSLLCSRCLKSDFLVYKHPMPRIIQILLVYDVCADSAKKAAPKLEQLSL